MRKSPSYMALLRPTRLSISEKSATYTINWSNTIIWQVSRVHILIKTSTNCSCNNCVINIGKKMDFANLNFPICTRLYYLINLFPIYTGLRSNIIKTIYCSEGTGSQKTWKLFLQAYDHFRFARPAKKAALTEHQKCTKLLVEMTSSMMHIFVFLQKIWVIQTSTHLNFIFLPKFVWRLTNTEYVLQALFDTSCSRFVLYLI